MNVVNGVQKMFATFSENGHDGVDRIIVIIKDVVVIDE